MIKSLAVRNFLSFLLLVVAIVAIFVQVRLIRMGHIEPTARLEIAAYLLIAVYAIASIAVRFRGRTPGK